MTPPPVRPSLRALLCGLLLTAACEPPPTSLPSPLEEPPGTHEAPLCLGLSVTTLTISGISSYKGELAGSGSWAVSSGSNAIRLEYYVDGILQSYEERVGTSGTWYFSGTMACGTHTFLVKGFPMVIDSSGNRTTCASAPKTATQNVSEACLTGCSYTWSAYATGWRTRTWTASDCSDELPVAGSIAFGQASNGSGTSGQTSCALGSGSHYNNPTYDGATSGTARCLYVPAASASPQPSPAMTVCSYTWSGYATGWRYRTWQASDCSHGLPPSGAWSIGQAENGNGTEGMPSCSTTQGGHYNHASWSGATSGTVRCAFVAPTQVASPDATLCKYTWSAYATGWRTRTWTASDCSHGLPPAGAWAIGSSENGSGAGSMAQCDASSGSHYNHPTQAGATNGTIRCLYIKRR